VIGGSLGAASVNENIRKILPETDCGRKSRRILQTRRRAVRD